MHGKQALIDIATAPEVTGVMCSIVGAAGLPSALVAAQHGKTIYLANKETLVVSGSLNSIDELLELDSQVRGQAEEVAKAV